jgi:two-component system, LytTR family, response regulator
MQNEMIEAVIVDDEIKALQSLSWELTNFSNEINVVASFTDPFEALQYLETHTPDCLFLDIEMPTMDGFQFIQKLKNKDFPVVITTAYNQYAIKALKNEAIDYLLKPIDTDDLKETLVKIKKHNSKNYTAERLEKILLNFNSRSIHKKITFNTDGKLLFLESNEILYAESDGNYSTIFLTDGQRIVLTKKLKEVNDLLPADSFFRIHNSFIINLTKIKEFLKTDGYVILQSNHKIPVSRQKKSDFLDLL